jgi:hypothetical protein
MVAVVANKGKIPVFMLTRVEMQRQIDDATQKAIEPLRVTCDKQRQQICALKGNRTTP